MKANKIELYEVRVPGETRWSAHRTLGAAQEEKEKANLTCRSGHQVYARHENGDVSGPY